jgi:DNA-binding NarL/FixJ family response regulator
MKKRVLLVEPLAIVRDGLQALLEQRGEFTVAGTTGSAAEAAALCRSLSPEVVSTETRPAEMSLPEMIATMLRFPSPPRILVLSMYDDENSVLTTIRAGARGFVSKTASTDTWMDGLRTVAGGGSYWSPDVSTGLLRFVQGGRRTLGGTASPLEKLSPREFQVFRMVAEGRTSREVGASLGLSPDSVRTYRKTISKKLNVSGVAALTRLAISAGVTGFGSKRPPEGDNQLHGESSEPGRHFSQPEPSRSKR